MLRNCKYAAKVRADQSEFAALYKAGTEYADGSRIVGWKSSPDIWHSTFRLITLIPNFASLSLGEISN